MGITGDLVLDWALIGVSVFNTILQLWLGLTVLLNTERRTWGVWLMVGGLLAGAAFFISHTAILGQQLFYFSSGLNFWWQIGWIPVMVAPFAWYIMILWYTGFWRDTKTHLRRRHRFGLLVVLDMAFGLAFLVVFFRPIPSFEQVIMLDLSSTPTINGVPILFTLFPIFMIVCILLSIDALRHPEPADRLMGDLARGRSRPWLIATAVVLLVVSVLVAVFINRVFSVAAAPDYQADGFGGMRDWTPGVIEFSITYVALFDLTLESLVAVATILLGQAIVAYEVFTGKVLPRRGFVRQWHTAIVLAAGYAAVIGFSLAVQLRLIYSLLLTALLMVVFYALYNWRSFLERERFMEQLRPFVSSQRLMGQMLSSDDDSESHAYTLFQAMCRDVLDAREAHLIPSGELSPLVGAPLSYPKGRTLDFSPNGDFQTSERILPLDPALYSGLCWAIPLWAERGHIGTMLLSTKSGGGLYTQEEIEIARGTGERIIDMLAGEQMARRLMVLQRGRLAESRVMDRRTRRTLHDETLPTLHTALLSLSSLPRDNPAVRDAIQSLTRVHQQVADLIHTAHGVPAPPNGSPDLGEQLRRMVEGEFADEFNAITWDMPDHLPPLDPVIQDVIVGAVREAARNAAVHGRGSKPERPLNLSMSVSCDDDLAIIVRDDGVGLHASPARSAIPAGSGGGLTLHSTMLAIIGGTLTMEARPEGGTQITIRCAGEQIRKRGAVSP